VIFGGIEGVFISLYWLSVELCARLLDFND